MTPMEQGLRVVGTVEFGGLKNKLSKSRIKNLVNKINSSQKKPVLLKEDNHFVLYSGEKLLRMAKWNTMADTTPIGRNGTDEEVGDFCAYLCTEAASWIHGQSINQNGGTVMEH